MDTESASEEDGESCQVDIQQICPPLWILILILAINLSHKFIIKIILYFYSNQATIKYE